MERSSVKDSSWTQRWSRSCRWEPSCARPTYGICVIAPRGKGGKRGGKGGGKGGKGSGVAVMTVEATRSMIAKIYAARLQADAWAKGPARDGQQTTVARFDAFVMRYFKRSCGTRGVARRTLRSFVASLEAHGGGGDISAALDGSRNARIVLFCALSGVGTAEFNPRLLPTFMLPVLRIACPEPRFAVRTLDVNSRPVTVSRQALVDAVREPTEPFLGRNFVERTCAAAAGFKRLGATGDAIDLDRALVTALEL